ncbi:MAG: DUF1919 domain-containing protein [Acutalibacteraceae bacterium]
MRLGKIWLKINLFNKLRIKKNRKNLKNKDLTIITSNCIGGLIYNSLGLRFNSPTINTSISSKAFVKFILDIDNYLNLDLTFIDTDKNFPVGMLGDIKINFVHYKTEKECAEKWETRKKRMDFSNAYYFLNDRDGINEDDLKKLDDCGKKNIVVFTSKPYPYKCAFYLPSFKNQPCVGNVLKKWWFDGRMEFEKYLDIVSLFNASEYSSLEEFRIR